MTRQHDTLPLDADADNDVAGIQAATPDLLSVQSPAESRATRGASLGNIERWRPPVAGTVLGSYELRGSLGRGSMGVVMKARDRFLDRMVAIKFVHPSLARRPGVAGRFEAEARVMAKIRHEHVTAVHAFGEHEGAPYFVMEYVEGHDLEELLRRRRGMPLVLDEALAILDAVCRGVQAVHSAGAVHGDLKPANVLLGDANRVVVSDFGAARTVRDEQASGDAVHGTPAYLAPEYGLSHNGSVAHPQRADLYSLGVMAYELLTGRLPFEADDVLDMLNMHATEDALPPSRVNTALPDAFDAVLLKALAKEPDARQSSVQRFRQELNAARLQMTNEGVKRRFVVADDEPVFRLLGQTILQAGFPACEVVCAEDGLTAFDAVVAEATSLALVDLDMPGLDGLALVQRLRADKRGQRVPIIVITGAGGEDDWRALTERGASAFLVKPVDPDAVLALVRRLLHSNGG